MTTQTHVIKVGVKEDSKQTTTVFPVDKNDHVSFMNRGPDTLTVTFDARKGSPLCNKQGGDPSGNPITVQVGETKEFKVCKGETGESFAYTAQISNYSAEDPIVIIEKSSQPIMFSTLAAGIAGFAVGAAVVALLMRSMARKPSMQA